MPMLKQPTSLEAMAMQVLLKFAVEFCDQLSTEGRLHMLHKGISLIKEDFCNRMPWCFLPEFCATFLEEFCQKSRAKRHCEVVTSRMVLDVDFVGLRCGHTILRHLNHQNVHRLRGLVELRLVSFTNVPLPTIIGNYRLNDLTTLVLSKNCSDQDLRVIGRICSKLRVLKLRFSRITDGGLRALNSCSDLRVVDISDCINVTDIGVNLLISAHDKLNELSYNGCDFLSSLNKPCFLMERFCLDTNVVTNANLRSIASMFPNLTHFETRCQLVEDLSILKSLNNLKGISIGPGDNDRAWQSLEELLTFIGGNIKTLRLRRRGLDFIFRSCPNIEYLECDHGPYDLEIPPFKKLKTLNLHVCNDYGRVHRHSTNKIANIGEMLNLEILAISNFKISFPTVKEIILDNMKFPRLTRIGSCNQRNIHQIEAIVRKKNLDVEIR